MKMKRPLAAMILAVAAPLSGAAWAQSASTQFDVRITIESTCSVDTPAATDVDFGTVTSTATNIQAEGTVSVQCTIGTPWDLALDGGLNSGGDVGARAMSDGAGTLVPYQLYQDSPRTLVWGDTVDVNTVEGVGIGDVQEVTVYGLVPSANFPAGSYSDTVTATVIW